MFTSCCCPILCLVLLPCFLRYPALVPYAVDERGRLVGGALARSRGRRQQEQSQGSSITQHGEGSHNNTMGGFGQGEAGKLGNQGREGSGSVASLPSQGSSGGARSEGRRHGQRRQRHARRRVLADGAGSAAAGDTAFWERQRFMITVDYTWDSPCLYGEE